MGALHFTICVRRKPAGKMDKLSSTGIELELRDESSNGTWVNDSVVGKGNHVSISTGDRVFVLPSARVEANAIIGFVVVVLPCQSEASFAKENDSGNKGNRRDSLSGGLEAERQLVSIIQCRLCEDALIHRCVTAIPCGHNFCCGCMIEWCQALRAPKCPSCDAVVRQLVRNHSIDSIVDTFIHAHPEAARPTESLERLNAIESNASDSSTACRLLQSAHCDRQDPQPRQPPLQRRSRRALDGFPPDRRESQDQERQRPPHRQDRSSNRRPSQATSAACVIS